MHDEQRWALTGYRRREDVGEGFGFSAGIAVERGESFFKYRRKGACLQKALYAKCR